MQTRLRHVARLERLVIPYLARKEQADVDSRRSVAGIARTKLANIALLSLYGKPRITESLENAWRRCRESSAWKACRERHPDFGDYNRDDNATPFERYPAKQIAAYFERHFLPELPGADEREKFELIFRSAAPWLLWFTYTDINAHVLGIKMPDLSSVSCCVRDEKFLFDVPKGPFEYRPWPDGVYDKFSVQKQKRRAMVTEDMTPRQRKRVIKIFGGSDEFL
jgi:hypothetical protein